MPTVTIRYFGPASDWTQRREQSLPIEAGETLGALAGRLAESHPKLGAALGVRLAVNRKYVALDCALADGDEIAVIPPVSGG